MLRHKMTLSAATLALAVMTIPSAAGANHRIPDERPTTSFEDLLAAVGAWIDRWMDEAGGSFSDDHAPLVAMALYESLLGIRPEPCYRDTYAAYWAVAADLRALGRAPTREIQEAEFRRVSEDVARADTLAELNALDCGAHAPPSVCSSVFAWILT